MMGKRLLAGALFCWSMQVWAMDFSEADAKFSKRDVDLPSALDARSAYKSILDASSSDADRLRAAEGYLRTYLFEGTHYHSLDTEEGRKSRKLVFSECWSEAAETISPTRLGFETAVYYYFRAACLAYAAQVSSFDEQLQLVPPLMEAIQKGLQTDGGTNYEAGGLYRVAAAVKYNPAAKPLPGGLYNPHEALALIDMAIAAGPLYCENFSHKARNLMVLDQNEAALTLTRQSLLDFQSHLDAGHIPEFYRAETLDCLQLLEQIKAVLENL